jgi:hypothetical protein
MPYPKEFPHLILNIGRHFKHGELVTALGQANARRVNTNAKNTTAFHNLSDAKTRLEYEILLPIENSDLEIELVQLMGNLIINNHLPDECPALPFPPPLSHMTEADFEADFIDIVPETSQISLADKYDNISQVKLPIVFDK